MCRLHVLGAGKSLIQPVNLAAELHHEPSLLLHVLGLGLWAEMIEPALLYPALVAGE